MYPNPSKRHALIETLKDFALAVAFICLLVFCFYLVTEVAAARISP